uniref:Ovule protein n=1 Tax=Heterorhabditis bacteriophora TaxID=37862 RepID=A0A1I7WPT8_HETBA
MKFKLETSKIIAPHPKKVWINLVAEKREKKEDKTICCYSYAVTHHIVSMAGKLLCPLKEMLHPLQAKIFMMEEDPLIDDTIASIFLDTAKDGYSFNLTGEDWEFSDSLRIYLRIKHNCVDISGEQWAERRTRPFFVSEDRIWDFNHMMMGYYRPSHYFYQGERNMRANHVELIV